MGTSSVASVISCQPEEASTSGRREAEENNKNDGDKKKKYGLRRRGTLEPSGKPLRRNASSLQRLQDLADWKRMGLHSEYADAALTRPLLRGWLHVVRLNPGAWPRLLSGS